MKPTDLNSNTYIDIAVENNNKDHKFEIGDYVMPWCSGCNYFTTSFNKVRNQVLRRFKSCLCCVGNLQW